MDFAIIIAIYLLGLLAMLVELFLPGVIIGVTGFLAVVGSIVYAFAIGMHWTAAILIVCTLALMPVFFALWKGVVARYFATTADQRDYRPSSIDESLVGAQGVALSPLRPSGIARLNEKRYDVVTEGEMLSKGTPIVVTEVSGNRIVVRKVE